ncbi:hypothetical protein GCM10011317_16730 [Niveispirillum cyanobacteriorum]|nr:hypothetical protein GCM10011317_16730 [Niveispirillum cyanobacteriorum]
MKPDTGRGSMPAANGWWRVLAIDMAERVTHPLAGVEWRDRARESV